MNMSEKIKRGLIMKYVYVIICGCYGDEGIKDIFSSEKKAREELEKLNQDNYWKTTTPYIEKWEVK